MFTNLSWQVHGIKEYYESNLIVSEQILQAMTCVFAKNCYLNISDQCLKFFFNTDHSII